MTAGGLAVTVKSLVPLGHNRVAPDRRRRESGALRGADRLGDRGHRGRRACHTQNLKSNYVPTFTLEALDQTLGANAMNGFLRADGRKGIRNVALVVYLVECAHFVAREIAQGFRRRDVQVIGFTGCYPSSYGHDIFERLCTHPNVGAVLIVSLGCRDLYRHRL